MGISCGKYKAIINYCYIGMSDGNLLGIIRLFEKRSKHPWNIHILLESNTIKTEINNKTMQFISVGKNFTEADFTQIYNFIKYEEKNPIEAVNEVINSTRNRVNTVGNFNNTTRGDSSTQSDSYSSEEKTTSV